MNHNNSIFLGENVMSKEAKIEFLNDLDFKIIDLYCAYADMEVVVEDGRITDFMRKEETNE